MKTKTNKYLNEALSEKEKNTLLNVKEEKVKKEKIKKKSLGYDGSVYEGVVRKIKKIKKKEPNLKDKKQKNIFKKKKDITYFNKM